VLIVVNSSLIIFTDSQCQCSTTYTINKHYGTFTNHTIIRLYAECSTRLESNVLCYYTCYQGRIQDFKLGGSALKKIAPSGGRREILFGVFRVKNHDFTPKNHIFANCRGRRENFGVFRMKNHDFTPKNHIFSNFGGGGGGGAPGAPSP
jgi:hypothetical protein